ncbi:MAG: GNAT family N-acetyltransferase [Thermomicrobiales bacterium]
MVASTISRVGGDEEAIRTLNWLGGSFFRDIRLAQFTLDTWAQMGTSETTDWATAGVLTRPRVELWSITGEHDEILGAMTLHFYSWKRLRQQHYFSTSSIDAQDAPRICVRRFDRLVASATGSIAPFDFAVELGYVAVDPRVRGLGLGRTLFDLFLHRAASAGTGRALAFTIVLSRHAHSGCGSNLMSHLIGRGVNDPRSAMRLDTLRESLSLPGDMFDIADGAYPTARLARQRGFLFAGYGRNLGQVWIRDEAAVRSARVALPFESIAATPLSSTVGDLVAAAR